MERLQYLSNLNDIIKTNLIDIVGDVPRKLLESLVVSDDMPNVIICCKSSIVIKHYIEKLLTNMFQDNIVLDKAQSCSHQNILYKTSNYYHEINLECVQNSDKNVFVELLSSIVDHRSFSKRRNVILLNNIDLMSHSLGYSLHSMVEKYCSTTFFIMTSNRMASIPSLIQSRSLTINISIDMKHIYDLLIKSVGKKKVTGKKLDDVLFFCDNDPLNMCALLELDDYENYRTHLFGFVFESFNSFVSCLTHALETKVENMYKQYYVQVREFSVKVLSSCVPINDLAKHVIKYVSIYFPCQLNEVISLVASMEHASHNINKLVFVIDTYVDKIARVLVGRKADYLPIDISFLTL